MCKSNDKIQVNKSCIEKQSNESGTQIGVKSEKSDWKNSQSMSWRAGIEGWNSWYLSLLPNIWRSGVSVPISVAA